MYIVKCDDLTLWTSADNKLKLVSPTIKLEVNKIGSFSFKIYPDHLYYNRLQKMRSVISVYQDKRVIFKGRIYSDAMDFQKTKKVEVEGLLGYFNDSIVRPYDYSGTVKNYFTMLVNQHNNQVEEFQRFKVGVVTVTDSDENDYITRASSDSPKTWDEINKKLIKLLGGHISIRYETDGNYIDYLKDYSDVSTQSIAFAVNLLDLNLENKADKLSTCIIPYGKKDSETGKFLDITSVNNGLDYIYDAEAVAKYGRIFEVVKWEDVTVASNLLRKATYYLADKIKLLSKLTVKAVDLHLTDETIEAFKLGDYVQIYSDPHSIDELILLTAYSMDLSKPSGATITLGLEKSSFLGEQMDADKDNITRIDTVIKEVGDLNTVVKSNVKTVEVLYYLSTSSTELIGGSWSKELPEWIDGRFYWQKTVTTHVNGTSAESEPICLTGNDGKDGEDGKDGQDATPFYTWIKYADSPTSGISDNPDGKKYIGIAHNKTEKTESNNYSDYTWSLIKGADGVPGKDGENGVTYYTWIKYADNASGANMSDDPTGKYYIGLAYNKTTATESSDASAYTWSLFRGSDGVNGSNGSNGKDGVGVKSINTQFYLSTSETELKGGSWLASMPEWSVGAFLWLRSIITYTDNTVAYTTPVCDSSWTAIDNLEIGGRNYLRKTDVSKFLNDWVPWNSTLALSDDGYLKITPNSGASSVGACPPKLTSLNSGETYTVSFDAYAAAKLVLGYNYIMADAGNSKLSPSIEITTAPKRYSFTFEAPNDFENSSIMLGYTVSTANTGVFYIKNLKLEKGNKATDWTPAPEDTTTEIENFVQETYSYINKSVENSEETTRIMLKEYAKTSDIESVRNEMSTSFTQTAEDFAFRFDTVNDRITTENAEINRVLTENSKYIRLVDGNIILGEKGALLTTKIANGRISFLYNDTVEVAYISEQKLYITQAEILESIVIGNFAYIPRKNGNLSFKKIK